MQFASARLVLRVGWEMETETAIYEKCFLSNHESHGTYPILMISIPLNSFGCVEIIPAKYITIYNTV